MILVFGAGGQLGQALAAAAAAAGVVLHGHDRRASDVANAPAVAAAIAAARPAVVVNAAAFTRVDDAEADPQAAHHVNARGAEAVARETRRADVPLIHISTDYVFDGSKATPYVETDAVAPLGVYGRSKAEGEAAVRAENPRHVILRTAWLFGRFGRNILGTVLRLCAERDELRMVADRTGTPTDASDLARAILVVADRLADTDPAFGTYHFAGRGVTSWHGFAEHIAETQARYSGRRPRVIPIAGADYPAPAPRPANSALDSGLFTATFGLSPVPWQQGVESAVAALMAQQETAAR